MSRRQSSVLMVSVLSVLLVFLFGGFAMSCGKVANDEGGFCGDQTCSGTEDCTTCQRDCGMCAAKCGDLICSGGESCSTCADDCGDCSGAFCDNGTCDPNETCASCARDCGVCADTCGDGSCTGSETCNSCSSDCGGCIELCGNGVDDDFDTKTDESGCVGDGY
ncbi:MAG: hypothetical protein SFX73_31480 [Kofleriaceae bacterium]|nr:hypothetical protein [Kofleriaceae bacterium]